MDNGATCWTFSVAITISDLVVAVYPAVDVGNLPQYQRENIGVEAGIIRLWKFPKEMKEFTIDQQKT